MKIQEFFDKKTFTLTYVVSDEETKDAVVIDPVLDFCPETSKTETKSLEPVIEYIKNNNLKVHFIMETHAHADHLSSSQVLKKLLPNHPSIVINDSITEVQKTFKEIFNNEAIKTDGSQFDYLTKDGETIHAGALAIKTIKTPGHTPACSTFLIRDAAFTGDLMFMPDSGTGRCDFPRGDAKALYDSVKNKIHKLPDNTTIYVGHDYQPNGRRLEFKTTVGEEKRHNFALNENTTEEDFVKFRKERDAKLNPPKLIYQSIQVNIDAGRLPKEESNGTRYLKIPIT